MKNFSFSNVKNFRYERKFYIEGFPAKDVESMLKLHPAIFKEIYHERIVNNIYFDSFDLRHYFENIDGISKRLKVRIRWYGESIGLIENPVLELKLKHNFHVGKLSYPLNSFKLDNNFSIDTVHKVLKESRLSKYLNFHLKELSFSLLNSYRRKYFLSADRRYRITLDSDLKLYRLSPYDNNLLYKLERNLNTIMELKYNEPGDMFADEITNYFPFRMTRSSKYVDGVAELYR